MDDIFSGKGVEIRLNEEDDFLKIRETLTRIGVASSKERILYQSCHILHKQGKYVIIHFKELFELDGKSSNFSEEDCARRNTITKLLVDWGLITLEDPDLDLEPLASMNLIKIISYKDKNDWTLVQKYAIGKKK